MLSVAVLGVPGIAGALTGTTSADDTATAGVSRNGLTATFEVAVMTTPHAALVVAAGAVKLVPWAHTAKSSPYDSRVSFSQPQASQDPVALPRHNSTLPSGSRLSLAYKSHDLGSKTCIGISHQVSRLSKPLDNTHLAERGIVAESTVWATTELRAGTVYLVARHLLPFGNRGVQKERRIALPGESDRAQELNEEQ